MYDEELEDKLDRESDEYNRFIREYNTEESILSRKTQVWTNNLRREALRERGRKYKGNRFITTCKTCTKCRQTEVIADRDSYLSNRGSWNYYKASCPNCFDISEIGLEDESSYNDY